MVMGTKTPQGARLNPQNTLELSQGMSIQTAINTADAHGGNWTIILYPGAVYNEGDLTPNGGANITLKGMGEDRVVIAPTVAPAIAVIVSAHTLNIEDITVTAPTNAFPAVRVTAGTFRATSCELNGVPGGAIHDAVQQVGGAVTLHDCQVPVGDIDLRDAACTFTAEDCNINGPLDTADGAGAGVLMTVTVRHCDCNNQAFNLAATGACVYEFHSNNEMGAITDASLGAGAVNGHLCRCHDNGAFVKNGTTGWLIDNTGMLSIDNANATGVISVYGGIFLACGNATGVTLWYKTASLMWVLPSGATDEINVQAAIDALPATGGEVFLLEGTYYIESSLVLGSYQTLRGCGRNTILTTTTADLDIITATGGAGSERVGILIADLCVDGAAGGVANDIGILWTYVDYSKIRDVWSLDNGESGIKLNNSDFNELIGNTVQGNDFHGIYLESSLNNTISGNTCLGNSNGIYLYTSADNNTIAGNTCQGNSDCGIYITSSSDNTISGNTCQGNGYHGICLDASLNNTATGNTCLGNGYQGILINSSSDNTISGNTCQENTFNGINLAVSSERNTISGNNCSRNNEMAICLHTASNNTIAGNLCQKNGRYGIVFVTASNNTISGNTIVENSQMEDIRDDNINLQTNSNYNLFTGNVCRKASVSTTLTGAHNTGVTAITLASTAGFRAGGGITFNPGGGNDETKIVATITDATHLTITLGLTNDHINAETVIVPRTRYGIYIWDANCIKNLLIGNDLYDAGSTANLNDGGTLTIVQDDNRGIEITQVRHYINVKNTSGGAMAVGDVTSLKAVAAGNEITPPVAVGERQVYGMVAEIIADTASGLVLVKGFTNALKGTNVGGGNIAIGDNLITENGVRARKAAADTDPIFARALEVCNAADVTIDAYIKSPWD